MAWEWVAPIATLTSGALGMFFTYRGAARQQTTQITLLRQQLTSQTETESHRLCFQAYTRLLASLTQAHTRVTFHWSPNYPDGRRKRQIDSQVEVMRETFHDINPEEIRDVVVDAQKAAWQQITGTESISYLDAIDLEELSTKLAEVEIVGSPSVAKLAKSAVAAVIEIAMTEGDLDTVRQATMSIASLREAMRIEMAR